MVRSIFIFLISFQFVLNVAAQKKIDTVVYYLNANGNSVSTKDSANYFLVILPPDTSINKNLFIVNEYYKNGKTRLMGNSYTNNLNLRFQGAQVIFFENGHRKQVTPFDNGTPLGDVVQYYPNGKLYLVRTYSKNKVFLKQYNDSLGNVLTENGHGKWREYADDFKHINAEGYVTKGVEDGIWNGKVNDSVKFESVFKDGKLISSTTFYTHNDDSVTYKAKGIFAKVDVVPVFPGGLEAFGHFLGHNIRYPSGARENGTQGRVIMSFVVETDGSLTDVKVARGIGSGCDEECVRVMKLSPKWTPGLIGNKPVRVAYSVPIAFTISN